MSERRRAGVLALVLALTSVAFSSQEPADEFDEAAAAERDNVSTISGKELDLTIGQEFGARHASTMERCTKGVPESELTSFAMLIRLDAKGYVSKTLVRPMTKVAVCLRDAVAHDRHTAPPRDSYWVRIDMTIAQ